MVALREPRLILPKTGQRRGVPKAALERFVRGEQLHHAGRFQAALAEYDRALGLWPDSPGLLNNKGNALYHLGRYEEAIDAFDRAASLEPHLAEAHVGRGVALAELNRHEEALEAFEKAANVRPDYFDAVFNRGLTLLKMGALEDADAAIKAAMALLPDADLLALQRELGDEMLRRLRHKGAISWSGGKPTGARPRVRVSEGPPLSDYVIESRR